MDVRGVEHGRGRHRSLWDYLGPLPAMFLAAYVGGKLHTKYNESEGDEIETGDMLEGEREATKKSPEILNVAPTPKDMPVHERKASNLNGENYTRIIGKENAEVDEVDGDAIMNNIFDEIGDFNMFDEEAPQNLKNTDIPY